MTDHPPRADGQRPPAHLDQAPGREARLRASRRILVVDDNVDATEALAMALEAGGHRVVAAQDGPRALELADQFRPEVVLLDIGLDGMDGYEVARRLRQQLGSARVVLVAITGFDHPDDRRRSAEVGFDHHLLKPIDPDSLLRLVSSLAG